MFDAVIMWLNKQQASGASEKTEQAGRAFDWIKWLLMARPLERWHTSRKFLMFVGAALIGYLVVIHLVSSAHMSVQFIAAVTVFFLSSLLLKRLTLARCLAIGCSKRLTYLMLVPGLNLIIYMGLLITPGSHHSARALWKKLSFNRALVGVSIFTLLWIMNTAICLFSIYWFVKLMIIATWDLVSGLWMALVSIFS